MSESADAFGEQLRPLSGQNSRGLSSAAREPLAAEARCEEIFDSVSGPFGTSLKAAARAVSPAKLGGARGGRR